MLSLLLFIPSFASQFRCVPSNRYLKLGNIQKSDYKFKNVYFVPPKISYTTIGSSYRTYSTKMNTELSSIASIPPDDNIITITLNYNGNVITLNRSKSETLRSTLTRLHLSILKTFDKDKNGNCNTNISLEDISLLDNNSNKVDVDTPIVDALLSAKYFSILQSKIPITITEPIFKNLKLYLKPLTGSPILPDFDLESWIKSEDLEFEWLHQQNDDTISIIHKSNHPTFNINNDLTGKLAVKIRKKGCSVGYTTDYLPIIKFDYSPWQYGRIENLGVKDPKNLRVISFNILAPVYLTSYESISTFFPYCAPEALTIPHRIPLILRELTLLKPDIACLQEVSQNIFTNYLLKGLKGYDGWFKVKSGNVYEGCSCLYNTERFTLVETLDLNFNSLMRTDYYLSMAKQILHDWPEISFDNYHTIYQIGLLREKCDNGKWIIVGNSHFYYHPSAKHIRFIQAMVFISQLEMFEQVVIDKYKIPESSLKVFACGDLNSKPEESIYDLFTKGYVSSNHPDISIKQYKNSSQSNLPLHFDQSNIPSNIVPHSGITVPKSIYPNELVDRNIISTRRSTFLSVYKGIGVEGPGVELEFSNIVESFEGLLDYIFYKNSKHVKALKGISKSEGRKDRGLPSLTYPSDHISIGADFEI